MEPEVHRRGDCLEQSELQNFLRFAQTFVGTLVESPVERRHASTAIEEEDGACLPLDHSAYPLGLRRSVASIAQAFAALSGLDSVRSWC